MPHPHVPEPALDEAAEDAIVFATLAELEAWRLTHARQHQGASSRSAPLIVRPAPSGSRDLDDFAITLADLIAEPATA